MIINDELHTVDMDFTRTHLSYALELLQQSYSISKNKETVQGRELSHRHAISSIIHGFAALESQINFLGYESFSNKGSKHYIQVSKTDVLLRKFIGSWKNTSTLEKYQFIVTRKGADLIPEKLNQELIELNNLRNWLVHGFFYTRTFLLEPNDTGVFTVVDTEDSHDWKKSFQQTKFKSLDALSFEDSRTALRIILKALKILSDAYSQPLSTWGVWGDAGFKVLFQNDFEIDELISLRN